MLNQTLIALGGKPSPHRLILLFVQSELGDVVYVELPEVGSEVKQGETFGVVESVKVMKELRNFLKTCGDDSGIVSVMIIFS